MARSRPEARSSTSGGTPRVAQGEWVVIRAPGEPPRRGQVIDAGEEITVVQVLEETVGLSPARAEITLTGDVATAVVGRELLGRVFNGMGHPLDGLPAPSGKRSAPSGPLRSTRPAALARRTSSRPASPRSTA